MSEIRFTDFVDVDAVIPDLAIRNIIETVDQVRNGCLTGTGCSYKRNFLSRLRIERYIIQHLLLRRISKIHMLQLNITLQHGIGRRTIRLVEMLPGPEIGLLLCLNKGAVLSFFASDKRHISVILFGFLINQFKHTAGPGDTHGDHRHLHGNLTDCL